MSRGSCPVSWCQICLRRSAWSEHDGAVTEDFTPGERWTVELWPPDAVVLFDWLISVDWSRVPVRHRAERQALADLLSALEAQVPVAGVTRAQIDRARREVSRDMGGE